MEMRIKENRISLVALVYCFMMIPFLHPKGLEEISYIYSIFFKIWTYLSALIVIIILLCHLILQNRFSIINKHFEVKVIIAYHISLLLITIVLQHKISEGIQKIFIYPLICLFFYLLFDKFREKAYGFICNYLILLFSINDTILNPYLFFKIFGHKHINFLGHIQVTAQFCLIALLVAYLDLKHSRHKRGYLLVLLSVLSLLMSDALTGYVTLVIFLIGIAICKKDKIKKMLSTKPLKYIVIIGIISFVLFYTSIILKIYQTSSADLTFSGRVFIWNEAWALIKQRALFGYGAYGVLIQPFWSKFPNSNGMNYAHNEILQLLLDGGVTLLTIFTILLAVLIRMISKLSDKNIKFWILLLLLDFLLIGLFESITENVYFFVFLVIIGNEAVIQKNNYVRLVLTVITNDFS